MGRLWEQIYIYISVISSSNSCQSAPGCHHPPLQPSTAGLQLQPVTLASSNEMQDNARFTLYRTCSRDIFCLVNRNLIFVDIISFTEVNVAIYIFLLKSSFCLVLSLVIRYLIAGRYTSHHTTSSPITKPKRHSR